MMKTISAVLTLLFLIFVTGCGYKEGVKTQERVSYLYFTGNAKGAEVTIDEAPAFIVEKTGVNEPYKVIPGKHMITIRKEGNIVVQRNLLLGDGHEREINVP